jgi:hypothetical protein
MRNGESEMFKWRYPATVRKRAHFTNKIESRPSAHVQLEAPACAFCPMKGVTRCEIPSCSKPLCERHRIRKAGGNLCPDHKQAVLYQPDAVPAERFGDRGDAVPHVAKIRSRCGMCSSK